MSDLDRLGYPKKQGYYWAKLRNGLEWQLVKVVDEKNETNVYRAGSPVAMDIQDFFWTDGPTNPDLDK